MRRKSSYFIFSFALLVTGFLIALNYQLTSEPSDIGREMTNSQWKEEEELRNEVLRNQQVNRELSEELRDIQSQIQVVEEEVSNRERAYYNLVEDIEHLRMVTGNVGVKGPGVHVTLSDADYTPSDDNPNNYIVHEQHVQQVVDELFVAGAEAVAINGHRLNHQSYIQCVGPVIEVDGYTSFAPFEVTALGNQDTLEESLNLTGGVKDQLVSENIQVRIEKKNEISLEPYFSKEGEDI